MLTLTHSLRPYLARRCVSRSRADSDMQETQFLLVVMLVFLVGGAAVVLRALAM